MAKEPGIVNQRFTGQDGSHHQEAGIWEEQGFCGWYLWVGRYIPSGSRPLVLVQKAVLAGTVSPEMKYSSLNIEGTEA